jgi:integrase
MRPRKIRVRRYSDRKRPHLKFVVNYREAGKRKRKFFEAEAAAKAEAALKNAELTSKGVEHAEFPTALRIMAQNAVELLKPFGKTITDAVKHYVAHLKSVERSCTIAALVEEVIPAKRKACGKKQRPASRDYIVDLTVRLGRFKKAFGDRIVAEITPLEIDDWLSGLKNKQGDNLSPQSRGNYARALGVALSYAVKRKYASTNPMKEVEKPSGDSTPEVLTVERIVRLLEVASPEILPYFAIGAFAGLRASEIERLDWKDIDFEENEIAVTGDGESHKSERHVDMLPNLRGWLLPLRKHTGKITPENFRKHFDSAREAAVIVPWPNNALRHSFGSYHLKHFNNDALTRLQMGHWRDSSVLFGHYRRAVTRRNAERYWNILPVTTEKIVTLVAQR